MNILIANRKWDYMKAIEEILDRRNNVTTAESGNEVIQKLESEKFNIAIICPDLPQLSGQSLFESMARNKCFPEILVLDCEDPIGSYVESRVEDLCRDAGCKLLVLTDMEDVNKFLSKVA
jgi:DNA-binding response OmpR family regulator